MYSMIAVLHVCTGNSLWIPTRPPSPPFSKKDSRLRYRATGGASTRSVMTLGASFQTWPMELDSRSLANNNRNRNNWKWTMTSFKMRTLYSLRGVCEMLPSIIYHYQKPTLRIWASQALRNVWSKSSNIRNLHLHSLILPNWLRVSFWMTAALGTLKTPSQNTEKHLSTRVLKVYFEKSCCRQPINIATKMKQHLNLLDARPSLRLWIPV